MDRKSLILTVAMRSESVACSWLDLGLAIDVVGVLAIDTIRHLYQGA